MLHPLLRNCRQGPWQHVSCVYSSCCILLLLRSRVPFHASFQRFEGDFEGVFLFYFRWGFEENEEIDQIH